MFTQRVLENHDNKTVYIFNADALFIGVSNMLLIKSSSIELTSM